MNRKVIVIGGPTASGKSGLAIDLAKSLDGEIINADSMQVYKDTPILSAVPAENEREGIAHHLFEIYESDFRGNVVDWLNLCIEKIKEIWAKNKTPIVVGGSGLYLTNLVNGTTPIPATKPEIRKKIANDLQEFSLEILYEKLKEVDEETALKLSKNDKTRIVRALEVYEDTKTPLSKWHKMPMLQKLPEADYFVIKILPNIKELEKNCSTRFEKMIERGALSEIEAIKKKNVPADSPAMKALGVPELLEYVNGKTSLEEAVFAAKLHTRQYAKRQLTWFRHQMNADYELCSCYYGEKNIVDDIKKAIKTLAE